MEKWTVWMWRNGLYGHRLATQRSDTHFETDGAAACAVCFKSLRDEAPGASWRNGLYRCILKTQRPDAQFETDGAAVCAVCFKSLRDEAPGASWRNGLYEGLNNKNKYIYIIYKSCNCGKGNSYNDNSSNYNARTSNIVVNTHHI